MTAVFVVVVVGLHGLRKSRKEWRNDSGYLMYMSPEVTYVTFRSHTMGKSSCVAQFRVYTQFDSRLLSLRTTAKDILSYFSPSYFSCCSGRWLADFNLVNFSFNVGLSAQLPIFSIINKIFVGVGFIFFLYIEFGGGGSFLKNWIFGQKHLSSWSMAVISKRVPPRLTEYRFLRGLLWSTSQLRIRERTVTC